MAIEVTTADSYFDEFVINNDAWKSSDESSKSRALNNAERILVRRYGNRSIPDEAVFEQALFLMKVSSARNKVPDGVTQYSVDGISVSLSKIDRTIAPEAMAILGRNVGISRSGRQGYIVRGDT